MLRSTVKTSSRAAKDYYTSGLARGDYYLGDQALPSYWSGKAAELLGLTGEVKRADFFRLCDNFKPDGNQLTPRTKANRRVGYDLNFDCPKSVSLMHAFGEDPRILQVFCQAVDETMRLLETDTRTRVRLDGKSEDRLTGNLVWGTFVHDTTRPVNGVPDPHLHSHCFAFNATFDHTEGRWKAAQLGNIESHLPYYEACFHSSLAAKVRELGYGVSRTGKFWEITSVPRDLVERFSHRSREIAATADRLGITDPEEKSGLGARTRSNKAESKSWTVVLQDWNSRFKPGEVDALRGAKHAFQSNPNGPTARASLEYAKALCMDRFALVPEKMFLEAALRHGVGHVRLAELQTELPKLGMAVREVRGERYVGDENRLRDEKEMLAFARETRGTVPSFLHDNVILPKPEQPRDEQVLNHLLRSRDRVTIVRLRPSMADAIVERLSAAHYEVTRFDARALDMPGEDMRRRPSNNPVWWVDHIQDIHTSQLAEFFRQADANGVRVVLVPSPGPVHPHSPLRLLGSRAGLRTPERQATVAKKAERVEAMQLLEDGQVAAGLTAFQRLGDVRDVSPDEFVETVTRTYVRQQKRSIFTRVTVNSDSLADAITKAIRVSLKSLKRIGRSRTFEQLRRVLHDEEARRHAANYKKGQVVLFFKSAKGFRLGQRYEVIGKDPFGHVLARRVSPKKGWLGITTRLPWVEALPLDKPERFGVFERSEIELAKGDMVRVTLRGSTLSESFGPEKLLSKRERAKNQAMADKLGLKTPDRRYRVEKGTYHRIERFTLGGHIQLANGWVLSKEFGHLEHGYCIQEDIADADLFKCGVRARIYSKDRDGVDVMTLFTHDTDALLKSAERQQSARTRRQDEMVAQRQEFERSRQRHRGVELER